jgi:hypothetical protein
MENLKITEKLSGVTQTELRISDVISRLFSRVETLYGKETDAVTYKIEMYIDGAWVVKHTYVPYERDDVEKVVRINDL